MRQPAGRDVRLEYLQQSSISFMDRRAKILFILKYFLMKGWRLRKTKIRSINSIQLCFLPFLFKTIVLLVFLCFSTLSITATHTVTFFICLSSHILHCQSTEEFLLLIVPLFSNYRWNEVDNAKADNWNTKVCIG